MVLTLSLKKLFKPILRLVIVVILILYIGFNYAGGYDSSLLPGFIIVLCIPVLPTSYLFAEYYFASRKKRIEVTADKLLIHHANGTTESYYINDFKIIELYKSKGAEKGQIPYQTAEMYYHAKIITNSDKTIILTSVLGPNMDDALRMIKGVEIDITRTVYSTIYW